MLINCVIFSFCLWNSFVCQQAEKGLVVAKQHFFMRPSPLVIKWFKDGHKTYLGIFERNSNFPRGCHPVFIETGIVKPAAWAWKGDCSELFLYGSDNNENSILISIKGKAESLKSYRKIWSKKVPGKMPLDVVWSNALGAFLLLDKFFGLFYLDYRGVNFTPDKVIRHVNGSRRWICKYACRSEGIEIVKDGHSLLIGFLFSSGLPDCPDIVEATGSINISKGKATFLPKWHSLYLDKWGLFTDRPLLCNQKSVIVHKSSGQFMEMRRLDSVGLPVISECSKRKNGKIEFKLRQLELGYVCGFIDNNGGLFGLKCVEDRLGLNNSGEEGPFVDEIPDISSRRLWLKQKSIDVPIIVYGLNPSQKSKVFLAVKSGKPRITKSNFEKQNLSLLNPDIVIPINRSMRIQDVCLEKCISLDLGKQDGLIGATSMSLQVVLVLEGRIYHSTVAVIVIGPLLENKVRSQLLSNMERDIRLRDILKEQDSVIITKWDSEKVVYKYFDLFKRVTGK